jgi:diadenosine tetraphosphate (Ap4A) HIT family hydrolase
VPTLIHRWVRECRSGANPRVVCRVKCGWVVMGEAQVLRGYSLVLPDPVVPHLNALTDAQRTDFLHTMSLVGDALLQITGAVRINYEILGNQEPALHGHVFPRFADEPEPLRTSPVWSYDWSAAPRFDAARDADARDRIASFLRARGVAV